METQEFKKNNINDYEVIIIGGSYSGLSAAMSLGRSVRKVLVIDSGLPCNRQTPHSHNYLTQDGKTPAEITNVAKSQVEKYPTVDFLDDLAIAGAKKESGFEIRTSSQVFEAKKLVFATGVKDLMPSIKGFSECWGISIVHCPYCHGYEIKGLNTGIFADGDVAMHYAMLVRNLTDKLTVYTNGRSNLSPEQREKLSSHGIEIKEAEVAEFKHKAGQIESIFFKDGSVAELEAMYAFVPFEQHCDIPVKMGCEVTETGHISVNQFQQTTVDGVFACGDNTTRMRSVASAVAAGNFAGAVINGELCEGVFNRTNLT